MTTADLAAAASSAVVWPPIIAVDPGSRSTGVCLRVGVGALEAVTVERQGGDGHHESACRYAALVIETCREIARRNRDGLNDEAEQRGVNPGGLRRAVETLVAPTPSARAKGSRVAVPPRVLAALPGASTVLGAVIGTWPQSILVAPRGGDAGGWDALPGAPENLRGRTPLGWMPGGSDRSHQRSAWALGGVAHVTTAAPLAEQVAAAVKAAGRSALDPAALVPALRVAIAEVGSWDLLERLPALGAAVAASFAGDRRAGERVKSEIEAYLKESEN